MLFDTCLLRCWFINIVKKQGVKLKKIIKSIQFVKKENKKVNAFGLIYLFLLL